MDDRSFDRLARLLGEATDRRAGLKAALGALFGAGGTAAIDAEAKPRAGGHDRKRRDDDRGAHRPPGEDGPDAEKRRKKRKKKCSPACTAGYRCVKGECVCESGVVCAGACCAAGQTCTDGACADGPGPTPACIAPGQRCKQTSRRCCDGRVCSSGQGGDLDVACYVPKTGRCDSTADCVYGMRCRNGRCEPPRPGELAAPCDVTSQQLCETPGAVCTAYTGGGAPGGDFCTLPLRKVCTGNPQCTCYKCWYTAGAASADGRDGRASTNTMSCCHVAGLACAVDQDCCMGLSCIDGICGTPGGGGGGTICVPDDAIGCDVARCCSANALCRGNVCKLAIPTGEECTTDPNGLPCDEAPDATCRVGDVETATYRCRLDPGMACDGPEDCVTDACDVVCQARTTEKCGTSNNGATCRETYDTCTNVGTPQAPDFECRSAAGTPCGAGDECISDGCNDGGSGDVCDALTNEACGTSNDDALCRHRATTDTCHDTGSGRVCLREAGKACTDGAQCISGECSGGVCKALTGEACGDDNNGAVCKNASTDTCQLAYDAGGGEPTRCLRAVGVTCANGSDCHSGGCGNGRCKAVTEEACGGTPVVQCQVAGDVCSGTSPNQTCLRPAGTACAVGTQCASGACGPAVSPATGAVCKAVAGETCGADNNGAACKSGEGTCRLAFGATSGSTRCRRDGGGACTANTQCLSDSCAGSVCKALDGEGCGASGNGAVCKNAPNATCTTYGDASPTGTRCLRANGGSCAAGPGTITADQTCVSEHCDSGTCVECAQDADCTTTAKPVCDTAAKTCVACLVDTDCAAGKVCKTANHTCVQCLQDADCSGQATNKACDTATNVCVRCTANTHCAGETTNKTCDTANKVCVQCLQASDCAALGAGSCTDYTTCTAGVCGGGTSKADNTKCDYSTGTKNGYCNAGTCQQWAVCTFDRGTCGNNDVTCGNALRSYIQNTGANTAGLKQVIGLPNGTYAASTEIKVWPRVGTEEYTANKVRRVEIARCGTAAPVLTGSWSGTPGDTTTGHRVLNVSMATLILNGVTVTNAQVKSAGQFNDWGGAIRAVNDDATQGGLYGWLEVRNSTITNSWAYQAAAIEIAMPGVILENTTITNCTSECNAGAIYANMASTPSFEADAPKGLSLKNVKMSGNKAGNAADIASACASGTVKGASLFLGSVTTGQSVTCVADSGNSINDGANGAAPIYDCAGVLTSGSFAGFTPACGCNTADPTAP